MKKIIFIASAFLVAGIAIGGLYYSLKMINSEKENTGQPKDEISIFFDSIKQETGINFSDEGEIEFSWSVEGKEEIENLRITGRGIIAKNLENEKYNQIKEFFNNNNFEEDKYNIAAGTIGGQDGYIKENKICAVSIVASDLKVESGKAFPTTDKKDIEIKCGILDESLIPEISTQKQINKIIALKYKTKFSAVEVDVKNETETYARGSVKILDKFAEGGEMNRGFFLAMKIENRWEVIHCGEDPVSCELVNSYNFPEDMISDCDGKLGEINVQ